MERSPGRGAHAVGHHQHSFQGDPASYNLLGCVGGLIIGLVGGLLLLIFASVVVAATATMPSVEPDTDLAPDLHLTVAEGFLNRYAEQPPAGSVAIDIIPTNEIQLVVKTNLELSAGPVPVGSGNRARDATVEAVPCCVLARSRAADRSGSAPGSAECALTSSRTSRRRAGRAGR